MQYFIRLDPAYFHFLPGYVIAGSMNISISYTFEINDDS